MRRKIEPSSEVFDVMAEAGTSFRHRSIFTAELEELALRWKHGKLLNLGCGHGADFIPFKDNFELSGVDFSAAMLNMACRYAQKYHFEARLDLADIRSLPYDGASFDWAIAVASLHHLKGHAAQMQALRELKTCAPAWSRGISHRVESRATAFLAQTPRGDASMAQRWKHGISLLLPFLVSRDRKISQAGWLYCVEVDA